MYLLFSYFTLDSSTRLFKLRRRFECTHSIRRWNWYAATSFFPLLLFLLFLRMQEMRAVTLFWLMLNYNISNFSLQMNREFLFAFTNIYFYTFFYLFLSFLSLSSPSLLTPSPFIFLPHFLYLLTSSIPLSPLASPILISVQSLPPPPIMP